MKLIAETTRLKNFRTFLRKVIHHNQEGTATTQQTPIGEEDLKVTAHQMRGKVVEIQWTATKIEGSIRDQETAITNSKITKRLCH